jgi:NDP-sugar pyrophosphorylase family protein
MIDLFKNYPNCFSIETDFFQLKNRGINIHGIELKGEFIDIGIPEDYRNFQNKNLNHD